MATDKKFIINGFNIRKHRLAGIWDNMKYRCNNKKCAMYRYYEGKGISVCDEWTNSYVAFYNWAISNGYAENLTIDRKNSNGNYEPSNCKWATKTEQMNNKKDNLILTYNNKTQTLAQHMKDNGLSRYKMARAIKLTA